MSNKFIQEIIGGIVATIAFTIVTIIAPVMEFQK